MAKFLMEMANSLGYEGDSVTEAVNWVGAVEKGLDMSKEGRLKRAEDMGFNTETVFHHGTGEEFDKFDKSKVGMNYRESGNEGFFFTKSLRSAKNYAAIHSGNFGGSGGRVISAYLYMNNSCVSETNSDYYMPADRFDMNSHDLMCEVWQKDLDSILIKGTKNDDLCVVFEPEQILSIHAAFDPEVESFTPKVEDEFDFEEPETKIVKPKPKP